MGTSPLAPLNEASIFGNHRRLARRIHPVNVAAAARSRAIERATAEDHSVTGCQVRKVKRSQAVDAAAHQHARFQRLHDLAARRAGLPLRNSPGIAGRLKSATIVRFAEQHVCFSFDAIVCFDTPTIGATAMSQCITELTRGLHLQLRNRRGKQDIFFAGQPI